VCITGSGVQTRPLSIFCDIWGLQTHTTRHTWVFSAKFEVCRPPPGIADPCGWVCRPRREK